MNQPDDLEPVDQLFVRLRRAGITLKYEGPTSVRAFPSNADPALLAEIRRHGRAVVAALRERQQLRHVNTCLSRYDPERIPVERLGDVRCRRCGGTALEHLAKEATP